MRNSMAFWFYLVASSFKTSAEYDGLINALTRVFIQKHVQTVTAITCWPKGNFFSAFIVLYNLRMELNGK